MSVTPFIPRILLTNDDGFDAPGLAALIDVARQLSNDIWIVAPQFDQSGMGQSITLNNPVRCQSRGDKQWAVHGTPADCVIMALSHLMEDLRPSLVLSGVNAGDNTGDDCNMSGTLGAAFTSLMLGVPSIAISLDCASRKHLRWDTARAVLPDILAKLVRDGWSDEHCLSINIPDLPPERVGKIAWTRPAQRTVASFRVEKREDLREKDYFWLYPEHNDDFAASDSDVLALAKGRVSISALALDRSSNITQMLFDKKTANDE